MPIQVVDAASMPAKPLHCFVYGPLGSGKTTFASTFPNPIFLSAGNEGGDTTLRFCKGQVIQINSSQDLKEAVALIQHQHQQYGWRTVVLDSVTYLSDLYISELTKNGDKPMQQRDWGMLDLFLQKWLQPTMRKLPLHVVWIAGEDPDRGGDGGIMGYRPMLYGKTSVKLPGTCDMLVRAVTEQHRDPKTQQLQTHYVLQTVPSQGAPARGRYGNAFADGKIPAHFNVIAQRIGPYIGEDPNGVAA